MPGSTICGEDEAAMAAANHHRQQQQPPPVAPRSGRPSTTQPNWTTAMTSGQTAAVAPPAFVECVYGERHARSGSMDSLESSGSSSGGSSCSAGRQDQVAEFVPARIACKAPKLPAHNPLQFVKVQSPLYKKAEQQIKLTKEVKITREAVKEGEEEWQSNLDNWKSRRRKVSEKVILRAEEMRQIEIEEQQRQEQILQQQRKIKKFSEIVEKRSSKRTYNFDLYVGQGDDSGLGGTPEPEDQDAASDGHNSAVRSDTSEGMTSEAESVDSDLNRSDKICDKEPPKVPKKPHSWTANRDIMSDILQGDRTSSPNELQHLSLANKDLSISDNISSAEPSDIEGHAGDTETVSSEEDISYTGQAGNVDSGLESLCDGNRPSDIGDSASDFSQDSCGGLDKNNHDVDPDFHSTDELEENKSKLELEKEVEIQESDGCKYNYKIAVKPGDNRGFGFTLKGGKDQGCAAYVDCVTKGGSADISGIKIGDKIMFLNGESTSGYSHASLVFSVKQAVYTGLLDIVVWRSSQQENSLTEEKAKPMRKGSSFADRLALFSNGVPSSTVNSQRKSPTSSSIQKVAKPEAESKTESLVLRRRSAFENGNVENSDFKSRRSSYISPGSYNGTTSNSEKRHSADLTTCHYSLPENGVPKKGKPPPVPVKPKLKAKSYQGEQLSEVSTAREKFKFTKQKTFDLDSLENQTLENEIPIYEPLEHELEKSSWISSHSSDNILSNDVKEYRPDEDLSLTENKIINSLENVLTDEQTNIENVNITDCKILDLPDSELLPPISNEMLSQNSKIEASCDEVLLTTSDSDFNSVSVNENFNNHRSNIFDTFCEEDNYQNDDATQFEPEENVLNYQDNYSDFYENEPIPSKDIDSNVMYCTDENVVTNTPDTYNIVCESSTPLSSSALQSSPESNSYSDLDSNVINMENLEISHNSTEIDLLEDRTFEPEPEAQAICDDINNDFVSPLSVCETSSEAEDTKDLEAFYNSELTEARNCMQMNLSPLCLPLEKIDEDDVISASTATSSDSPNTETVIETLPSNISPLPNDELNGENSSSTIQEPNAAIDLPLLASALLLDDESAIHMSSVPAERDIDYTYCYQTEDLEEQQDDNEYSREFDESLDQITSLDVIDEMEQRLMLQLEQQGDASFEDMAEDLNGQLDDEVNRQWLYLSEEAELLDDLSPRNLEPPREPPPPPPPPDIEPADKNELPFVRANSTKRIKKEIWRRRSDFLGLDSPEGIDIDNIPPPPPGLEEILKQEREQNQWLEKRLSLAEADYSLPLDIMEPVSQSTANTYSDYTAEYFLEDTELNCEDAENEDFKGNLEEQISYDDSSYDLSYEDTAEVTSSNTIENSKCASESPQHKAKQQIQSLGAAPRAKIMDSNKWITQAEKKLASMNQPKSIDPVFSHGSYKQNYWLTQDGERRVLQRTDTPAERRFSMPPTYSNPHPDVTVRTWGDREYEFQQQRPRSEFWNGKTVGGGNLCSPYSNLKQDVSRTRSLDSHPEIYNSSDTLESEVHKCSCCGKGLCEGSAMGIEALQLYFHIECFRCCTCHIPLGNGSCGTDVQVKNNQLYCPNCFTVD